MDADKLKKANDLARQIQDLANALAEAEGDENRGVDTEYIEEEDFVKIRQMSIDSARRRLTAMKQEFDAL